MERIFTSHSDREFKEVLSEQVKEAVKEGLHTGTEEKPNPVPQEIGYRVRDATYARRALFHDALFTPF